MTARRNLLLSGLLISSVILMSLGTRERKNVLFDTGYIEFGLFLLVLVFIRCAPPLSRKALRPDGLPYGRKDKVLAVTIICLTSLVLVIFMYTATLLF
jgi:hypothetical protein